MLIAAGIVAAFAVGKAPIALPSLQREFALAPVTESLVVSVLSLIGALSGMLFGTLADRAGHRRLMLAGLLTLGAASAAGAFAPSAMMLLLSRVVEGFGFIAVVVSGPRLVADAAGEHHRRLALGLWSAYIPAGTAVVMLAAPLALAAGGWRALWIAVGVATWAAAVVVVLVSRPAATEASEAGTAERIVSVLRAPLARALALGFAGYAAAYLALVAFLPTMLVDAAVAGTVSALIVVANGAGNVAGGSLRVAGVRRRWSRSRR